MIVLFHSLCFVWRVLLHTLCDKISNGQYSSNIVNVRLESQDFKCKSYRLSKRGVSELKFYHYPEDKAVPCRFDDESGLKFFPPVYSQRYNTIKELMANDMWSGKLSKVLDIGCAELSFFPFLKHLPGIEEIIAVDIDSELLQSVAHRVGPLLSDHLSTRTTPLHVMVLEGSIVQHDSRLLGCDAVIAIELIEHLFPHELEEVPYTIFGFIKPNVACITTPNADFNILFHHLRGFRHPDHKFEWTRLQFQDWCINISERYPDYEVEFHGIGAGPIGSEYLGCVSQMAVFTRKTLIDVINKHNILLEDSKEFYKVIADYQYPVFVDNRTDKQKMVDSVNCMIRNTAMTTIDQRWIANQSYNENDEYPEEDYDDNIFIPLEDILRSMEIWQLTEQQLRELLEENGWAVKEVDGKYVVDYNNCEDQCSIPSNEEIYEEEKGGNGASGNAVDDFSWDQAVSEGEDLQPGPLNLSRTPSCTSDWNEDDTQTRANMDSGYPNSFSTHDKDLGNSVDLHGSSLEEDSEDEMEEDIENEIPGLHERHNALLHLQDDDMGNQVQFNAAALPELFYEVAGNQDENQDLVNNNRDYEGNNAEAIFEVEPRGEEPVVDLEDGSESEGEVGGEQPSEEESEQEVVMDAEEDELMGRFIAQMQIPRNPAPPGVLHSNFQNDQVNFFSDGNEEGDGNVMQESLDHTASGCEQDEGFAEAMATVSTVEKISSAQANGRSSSF